MHMTLKVVVLLSISLHSIQCIDDTNGNGNRVSSSNGNAGGAMGSDKSGTNSATNDTNSADGGSTDFDKNMQGIGSDSGDDADAMEICNKTFTMPKGKHWVFDWLASISEFILILAICFYVFWHVISDSCWWLWTDGKFLTEYFIELNITGTLPDEMDEKSQVCVHIADGCTM